MKKVLFPLIIFGAFLAPSDSFALDDWCTNQIRADVWHMNGMSVAIGKEPMFSLFFTKVICCTNGTDMDHCNQSLEDPACSQLVVRGACIPIGEV
ncbi:hypothetical protein [Algoriphagus sp.]|uniref:hypothetical protein n=1 Tax=Algoriphagus sp. TaxID=1872435 RepID=UPI00326A4298